MYLNVVKLHFGNTVRFYTRDAIDADSLKVDKFNTFVDCKTGCVVTFFGTDIASVCSYRQKDKYIHVQ